MAPHDIATVGILLLALAIDLAGRIAIHRARPHRTSTDPVVVG